MIDDYLVSQATIKRAAPTDKWGEPTGAGEKKTVSTYFSPSTRTFTTDKGEEVQADGAFFFSAGTEIGYNDRIVDGAGKEHRPVRIDRSNGLDGEVLVRVWVQ